MSRFADPDDIVTKAIGDCQCPGTPHAQDEADLHRQLGHGAKGAINVAGWLAGNGVVFDPMAAERKLVELAVVRWNLQDSRGRPMAVVPRSIELLDEETVHRLAELANEALESKPLPNDSGAPSADSSQESGSRTPTKRARQSSTTT